MLIVFQNWLWEDMTNAAEQRKQFYRENPDIWKWKDKSHHQSKAPSSVPGEGRPAGSCHSQEILGGETQDFLTPRSTHGYSRCSHKHHFSMIFELSSPNWVQRRTAEAGSCTTPYSLRAHFKCHRRSKVASKESLPLMTQCLISSSHSVFWTQLIFCVQPARLYLSMRAQKMLYLGSLQKGYGASKNQQQVRTVGTQQRLLSVQHGNWLQKARAWSCLFVSSKSLSAYTQLATTITDPL